MKDFIKIFFILIIIVSAFITGRNYGEKTVVETADYKTMSSAGQRISQTESELNNIKEKFQNLLDQNDLSKKEDMYSKMMTFLLVDLGLRLTEEKQKEYDAAIKNVEVVTKREVAEEKAVAQKPVTPKEKKWSKHSASKFKSYEWMLQNTQTDLEAKKILKDLEIKDLDSLLKDATNTDEQKGEKLFGTYRGKIFGVDQKEYGSLVISLKEKLSEVESDKKGLEGDVKIYRQGQSIGSSEFTQNNLGLTPLGTESVIIEAGGRYYQFYKIESSQKLGGYFYERLTNGTTKTIGHFLLTQTGQ